MGCYGTVTALPCSRLGRSRIPSQRASQGAVPRKSPASLPAARTYPSMRVLSRLLTLLSTTLALAFANGTATAQAVINPNLWFRLTTMFHGPTKAMDVINDGVNNNRMHIVDAGPYTGQFWRFEPFPGFPGGYRIVNFWQGDNLPMDIINGGPDDNHAILAPRGPFSGQLWYVWEEPAAPGYYQLTTYFRGANMALEGGAGPGFNQPRLDPRGLFTGQLWQLTPAFSVLPASSTAFGNGCAGPLGVPTLSTNSPWLGQTLSCAVDRVPANAFTVLAFGPRHGTGIGLPGSPGCEAWVDIVVSFWLPSSNGTASFHTLLPPDAGLAGSLLQAQVLMLQTAGGSPLVIASNGIELQLGF